MRAPFVAAATRPRPKVADSSAASRLALGLAGEFVLLALCVLAVVSCRRECRQGASRAYARPIRNREVVLARMGTSTAAIYFTEQSRRGSKEMALYDWLYRDDGGTVLATNAAGVKSGHGRTVGPHPSIVIEDIRIDWSLRARGSGWVYYSRPGETASALEIAVTDLDGFAQRIDIESGDFVFSTAAGYGGSGESVVIHEAGRARPGNQH